MRRMWPVVAVLVLLTTACRLETNLTIEVDEDGSGTFTSEIGLDQEMRDLLEGFGGSDDLLAGLELGPGIPAETRTEGDMTYISASQDFASTDELQSLVDATENQASFDEFELVVDEEGARLVAKTGPLTEQGGLDPGSLPIDPSTIGDEFFSANVFVQLPGNRQTDNADEVMADGRLRWAISLTEPIDIEAETSFGGGGIPWLPIGIAAVAVLGIGAYVVARRGDDTAAAALRATQAPPAPGDFSDIGTSGSPESPPELPPELPPQT